MSNADKYLFIDSETCGLHSIMVLLQYAVEDGSIALHNVWTRPVGETLDLIEWICEHTVVGFNLTFDWFHIVKIYTLWRLLPRDWIPVDHIDEIAMLEPKAQDGPCVKPANALDLLLHSRKGPYQSLMARSDIRIRRVPTPLAYALANELESRVQIDGIYFAGSHDKDAPRWQVFDIKRRDGQMDANFKDVVLRFKPKSGLKFLAEHALGLTPKFHYEDVEPDKAWLPKEYGYAPTALSVSTPAKNWEVYQVKDGVRKMVGHAWPAVIRKFIEHWESNKDAREYATDDIVYTRELCKHFAKLAGVDRLPAGDDDSILACMVPVIRWHGFKLDMAGIRKLLREARRKVRHAPLNINKAPDVRAYIGECMDDMEKIILQDSTKKANVVAVSKWVINEPEVCTKCDGTGAHVEGPCRRCDSTGTMKPTCSANADRGNHPAALRAFEVLGIKYAKKEVELLRKLLRAKKFHASFNVIGTLSTRMSGGDGLNAQGIKSTQEIRAIFPLWWEGYVLCGGDFDAFEVTLADAVYKDPDLRKALTTKVSCHKCDGVGKVKKCKPCKGKGKNKETGKPCDDCEGKGRWPVLPTDTDLATCGECEGCGKTTKKIHALFAMCLYPDKSYEEIVASAGTQFDMYTRGKQGVFAMIYGGDFNTLVRNLGVTVEIAKGAFETWNKWFPQSAKARERTFKAFCSMRQPDGTQVVWGEPADYVESFLGFRRYFTLENTITGELFNLARKMPKAWKDCAIKVIRSAHKGVQVACGAVASALYGAAFQIQAGNQRAAANHEIQSPGGQITKKVQRKIWDLQPVGVSPLVVAPINIHDELLTVTRPDYVDPVAEVVRSEVEQLRAQVPLIGMTWNKDMASWAEKKSGSITLKIRAPELEMAA